MSIPTAIENVARIRTLLGGPLPTAPTDPEIYEALQGVLQLHHNELQNTSSRWSVDSIPLSFEGTSLERPITHEHFGKPFWAYVTDDLGGYERELALYDLANTRNDFSWGMFRADSIAVYRRQGNWYARYTGDATSQLLRVVVHFEDTQGELTGPTDAKGLSPFQPLMRIQACLSVLPLTEWKGCRRGSEAHTQKVALLTAQRTREELQHWASFKQYKKTINRSGVRFRTPNFDADFYASPRRGRFAG